MIKQTSSSSIDTTARLLLFPISNIDFESLSLPACLPAACHRIQSGGWPMAGFSSFEKKKKRKTTRVIGQPLECLSSGHVRGFEVDKPQRGRGGGDNWVLV